MSTELAGKTVLVTGSSRGIGRATATLLHDRGANVIVHARSATPATDELLEHFGDRGALVLGDLGAVSGSMGESTSPTAAGPASVWAEALAAFGSIDVLVNNAGAWVASEVDSGAAWDAGWDLNMQLNLKAPADLCREAILHFRDRDPQGGVIINLASRSSHRGDDADHLAYGAAKGGLLSLTRGIARGYGRDGVLAYAVAPGWVATDLADGAIPEEMLATLPLGEVTPATDVAEVIAFLATGRARHATGTTIDITGADYVR